MNGSNRTDKTEKETAPVGAETVSRNKNHEGLTTRSFAMTILPPKQGCDGNHELGCTHERGHFGRFFAFPKFAFSQPLLFEDLGYLLGFRERLHAPIYRRVAKTATLATWSLSGEGARRHG